MEIKYHVYYSISLEGPWTRATTTPLDDVPAGNSYTITGLKTGVEYYVMVIGGYINDESEWVPLSGQPIGPEAIPVKDITSPHIIRVKTFAPRTNILSSLSNEFEVV